MRKFLGWACIAAMATLWLTASAGAARKKTSGTAKKTATAAKSGSKSAKPPAKKTASKKGSPTKASQKRAGSKKGKAAPRTTWRNRQLTPGPERYKEIQEALAAKGYFNAADANGTWGQSSIDALKRFQRDQRIETTGKVNSLSLIALGLGPRREAVMAPPPEAPPAQAK